MKDFVVGVEAGTKKLICWVLDDQGQERGKKIYLNEKKGFQHLAKFLSTVDPKGRFHVCMTDTAPDHLKLARFIHEAGDNLILSVLDPMAMKAFATKSSQADEALTLARFGLELIRSGDLRPWEPEPAAVQQLRQLLEQRDHMLSMKSTEREHQEELRSMHPEGEIDSFLLASLQRYRESLDRSLTKIETRIKEHIETHEELKADRDLLASIPGLEDI